MCLYVSSVFGKSYVLVIGLFIFGYLDKFFWGGVVIYGCVFLDYRLLFYGIFNGLIFDLRLILVFGFVINFVVGFFCVLLLGLLVVVKFFW